MAGWILIGFLLLSMLIGALIPDSRFKLLGAAMMAAVPPALAALAYNRASETGCSGGDCTGAMVGVALLGLGAGVISCVGSGIFVQAALSMLLHKIALLRGSKQFSASIRFLPLLVPLAAAGVLYALVQRPPAPMPPGCDGRMASVRIGEARFHFPVTSEVEIWPNDRRDTAQSLSERGAALSFCKQATKEGVPLAQLGFSSPHISFQSFRSPPLPWLTRYFGASPPAGPRSLCDRIGSSTENQLFCGGDKTPRFAMVPSIPDISIRLLAQGSAMTLRGADDLPVEVTAANAAELLPTLTKSYPARTKAAGFEIYYDGPKRLIYRTDGARPVSIANCRLEGKRSLQCSMIAFLDGKTEMRSTFYLPDDADDAAIVATMDRISRFTNNLAMEAR